jgi:hypothetical protein
VNQYDVLGVAPTASRAQIAAAYRRLAKQIHPDLHRSATPEEAHAREIAMTRLNLAYEAARRDVVRADRRARHAPHPAPFPTTPPGSCDICGASPAVAYPGAIQSDWIASVLPTTPEPDLCAPCAEALGLTPPPAPTTAPSLARRARRWTRPGRARALLASGVCAILAVGAILIARPSETPKPSVGACVYWSGTYSTVPCTAPHSGRVVAAAANPSACPSRTSFARRSGNVLCIDTSQ